MQRQGDKALHKTLSKLNGLREVKNRLAKNETRKGKFKQFFVNSPLCKLPFSMRRASRSSRGTKRHNAVMICTKPDVGPPWVHKAL